MWRSLDGGTSWTEAAAGLPGAVAELAVDPQDPRVVYARLNGVPNVWKSTDSGVSWQATGLGQRTVTKLAASPAPGVLWASADGAVYRSGDSGATWQKQGDLAGNVFDFAFDPSDPERVYAATVGGVWVLGGEYASMTWQNRGSERTCPWEETSCRPFAALSAGSS